MTSIALVDISTLDKETYQQLYTLASAERRQRADRYLRKEDAYRCIIADGLLRRVLGADRWALSHTSQGKPFLQNREDLHFNLSHSGRWVVIAWADQPVGIDVEIVLMNESKERLAHRFFHKDEQVYVFAANGQAREQRFFEIWTKKESYLKYLGTGINCTLDSFSVFDLPDVAFYSQPIADAVITLCAADPECSVLFWTPQTLLAE